MTLPSSPKSFKLALYAATFACCAGCVNKGVMSFTAKPPLVCPGKSVLVQWNVDGAASLHAEPAPANWQEGPASSQGERTVTVTADTTFTVTALDANPAKGNSFGSSPVKLGKANDERGTSAPCNEQTRICSGSFELSSGGSLAAFKLANPTLKRDGHVEPREICVTPPGGAKTCVAAGGSAALNSPADGAWTLETTLKPEEATTPPPQLRVHFDFGCP